MEKQQSDLMKITGLYTGKSKDGKKYLSGNLSYSTRIVIFQNKFKEEGDKNPDMIMYLCPRTHEKKEDTADSSDVF